MNLRSLSVTSVSIVVLIAIGVASPVAGQNLAAGFELDPSQVRLIPKLPNEGMLLSVSGPNGYYFQRWFAAGTKPAFSVSDEDGSPHADGIYTYELRLSPMLSPETRSLLIMVQQTDNDSIIDDLRRRGLLPSPQVQSGTFTIKAGSIQVPQGRIESSSLAKDIPMLDDTIIEGRMCVGIECLIDEDFDSTDDVLRLKQDELRIHLDDTSTDTDFPTNSWRIAINDVDQYGASYLAVEDVDAGTTPFKIRAGAPNSSLYIDPAGNIGIGTATPEATLSVLGPVMVKSSLMSAAATPYYENMPACDGCADSKSLTPGVELHVLQGGTPPASLNTETGLLVQNTSADDDGSIISIMAGNAGSSQLFFGDPDSEYAGQVTYSHESDIMSFFTNNLERFRIEADGKVGIGTISPDGAIHVSNTDNVFAYFESTTGGAVQLRMRTDSTNRRIIAVDGNDNQESQIVFGDNGSFDFWGPIASDTRMSIDSSGNLEMSGSLTTAVAGAGIGTTSPVADGLHINTSTGAPSDILHLTNNGGSYIQFENTATSDSWYFTHEHPSPNRFIISSSATAGPEFAMTNSGDLEISGSLTTGGGGTCDPGPCDAVFTDYELESIEAHAAYMWENSHLWGIGPTPEGAPINLSQKTTGIIHELEKAHIYIEQLNDTLKAQQMMIDELKAELAELRAK